jgi:hypothetical protein
LLGALCGWMYCTVVVPVAVGAGVEIVLVVVDPGGTGSDVGTGPGAQTWFVFPGVHAYVCGAPVLVERSRHCVPPVSAMRLSAVKYQCCAARPG